MTAIGGGIVHSAGEGKAIETLGITLSLKAGAADTGGAWGFFEYEAPAGFGGPPPHRHRRMVEAFYVLEGELNVRLEDETVRLGPGAFALVPAGVAHAFSNLGTSANKFICLYSPGGFEGYFEELPRIVEQHGYPPPPEVMKDLGERYDFEPVGPPPGS